MAKLLLLLAILVVMAASVMASSTDDELALARARYRGRRTRHRRRTPAPAPPAPERRVPSPPPSPPAAGLLPCDRPDVPPVLAVTAQQNTSRADCIPRRAPTPPPPRYRRPPLCTCPKPPGFGAGTPGGGGGGAGAGSEQNCGEVLAAPMMMCGPFLMGTEEDTPKPQSECCQTLGAFLNGSRAATAAGAGDGGLRCLCPLIVGEVNRVLPHPVDPVRLLYLPIACGVVLPTETLFMCFTGHPSPKVVDKFSQLWENVHGG